MGLFVALKKERASAGEAGYAGCVCALDMQGGPSPAAASPTQGFAAVQGRGQAASFRGGLLPASQTEHYIQRTSIKSRQQEKGVFEGTPNEKNSLHLLAEEDRQISLE